MEFSYNDLLGPEKLNREYKKFTFNMAGLVLDPKLAEEYCSNNIFNFNKAVILNLKKYIKIYVTINACATFNSKIKSSFYIGVNDNGFVKGIPYCGELPIEYIQSYIYKMLSVNLTNSTLDSIDLNKYVKINIIKINKPDKPTEKINPDFSKYLKKKRKHIESIEKYDKDIKDWKFKFDLANQKLFKSINNFESRKILIEFIRSIDPTSPVIELLYTDYEEEYKDHCNVIILKEDTSSPYYWVTRWKDAMISKLRKEKPKPIKSIPNTPINLIMNIDEMIPWWMHNNDSMNLYIIRIDFETPDSDNLFSCLDHNKKKWLKYQRIIFNGGPSCFPL